ncbi:hypothetical protein IW261DRAFT_1063785 [Armillaria novae-zelandiae]|uniref:Mid2 domain-containing protein n=1 Tax=Armillaria novae-zelandiae TaxID=153914 RepID=A0AA39NKN8_9AGAR|nr:hypothetical protein IW261DRAFT_1063785 [Armillaria novae-zelandiae]
MLLVPLFIICYTLTTSYGFMFDDPPGPLIAEIPITIAWHRNSGDPDDIYFSRRDVVSQASGKGDSIPSSSDTTQPQGVLTVTFPSEGRYVIEVLESLTNDVVRCSHHLTVASQEVDSVGSDSVMMFTTVSATALNCTPTLASSAFTVPTSNAGTALPLPVTPSSFIPPVASSSATVLKQSINYVLSASSLAPTIGTIASTPSIYANPPSNSNQLSIIIGAIVSSLAFLLLLVGTGILFKRKRIKPYQLEPILPLSSPSDEGRNEAIPPMVNPETAHSSTNTQAPAESYTRTGASGGASRPFPVVIHMGGSMSEHSPAPYLHRVPQAARGKRTNVAGAERNSFSTPSRTLPVDSRSAREHAGLLGEERPRVALGDIETEVRRLKTQVRRILIQREAERRQGDSSDRPPSYTESTI